MKKYSSIFILLLVTEITIAVFHIHKWIRGFVGDVLVIPLLYCFIRMFTKLSQKATIIIVMLFAFITEILQLSTMHDQFKFGKEFLIIVTGNTFDPLDLVAYTLGLIPIYLIEKYRNNETH